MSEVPLKMSCGPNETGVDSSYLSRPRCSFPRTKVLIVSRFIHYGRKCVAFNLLRLWLCHVSFITVAGVSRSGRCGCKCVAPRLLRVFNGSCPIYYGCRSIVSQ